MVALIVMAGLLVTGVAPGARAAQPRVTGVDDVSPALVQMTLEREIAQVAGTGILPLSQGALTRMVVEKLAAERSLTGGSHGPGTVIAAIHRLVHEVTLEQTLHSRLGVGERPLPPPAVSQSAAVRTSDIPAGERAALIDLYNSTNGAEWTNRTNWRNVGDTDFNAPGTECTWYRVSCNSGQTTVLQLNLYQNNLAGTLPASLGALTNLQVLDLSYNHLTDSIPGQLANLVNLQRLRLHNNELTGAIPTELGSLTNLQYLWLQSNQLTGSIPAELGGLTNLTDLRLSFNQLTGSIPPELGTLTNLQVLQLNYNQLTGSIPPELGTLSSLQDLWLNSNQLTGSIPSQLGGLTNLKRLYLLRNQLTGAIPAELGTLADLTLLQLNSNQLTGSIPPQFGSLTSLQVLTLQSNQLTGSIPAELGALANLQFFKLSSNQLSGAMPGSITNLTTLVAAGSDFRWNGLYTNDPAVVTFLNGKQDGGDWQSTQTVPVTGLMPGMVTTSSVALTWTPITYTGDTGGYQVLYSETSGGPWTLSGTTADKTVTGLTVTGLDPGTPYSFIVKSVTNPHANNLNTVVSDPSPEVSQSTLALETLAVAKTGTGTGSVASTPAGIDCGGTCSASFDHGTVVALTPTADAASDFTGWSGACTGTGECSVTMDAAKAVTASFDLTPEPAFTSADHATFMAGLADTFTVTATGVPTPSLGFTGALPSGVTFIDHGNGSATLGGTPGPGTGGTYPLTFTAHNIAGPDAVQAFTLTVDQPAAITSADHVTFTFGTAGSFTVTATGYPVPTLGQTGALPTGVSFIDIGDGTGTLAGTPELGTNGDYPLTFTAQNGVSAEATQTFTLTVEAFESGDVNGDNETNVQDVFYLINCLFAGGPDPIGPGDVNGDGQVNVQDVFYLINYLFAGGPAPV